jgi:hypothetical protein
MADDPETDQPGGEAEPDPEFHLSAELGHELARLGRHPVEEVERLTEEAREGEAESTPGIVIAGLMLWIGLFVALLTGAALLVYYLVL